MHPSRTLLATLLMLPVVATAAGTLDRIKSSGAIKLGYGAEARPFSFQDSGGKPLGYGVELCARVVDRLKADQGVPFSLVLTAIDAAREVGVARVGAITERQMGLEPLNRR